MPAPLRFGPSFATLACMKLGRLVVLLMGLAAVAFAAKFALTGGHEIAPGDHSQPRRQLDNVRDRSRELEKLQQQQVDEIAKKSADQQ